MDSEGCVVNISENETLATPTIIQYNNQLEMQASGNEGHEDNVSGILVEELHSIECAESIEDQKVNMHGSGMTSHTILGSVMTEAGEQLLVAAGDQQEAGVTLDGASFITGMLPVEMEGGGAENPKCSMGGMQGLTGQVLNSTVATINGQRVIILTPSNTLNSSISLQQPEVKVSSSSSSSSPACCPPVSKRLKLAKEPQVAVSEEQFAKGAELVHETELSDTCGNSAVYYTVMSTATDDTTTLGTEEVVTEEDEIICIKQEGGVSLAHSYGSKSPAKAASQNENMDVSQAWFTTRDDKVALQTKGHQWKQGQWSKDEVEILEENISSYCKEYSIHDPTEVIFKMSKDERKDFYRTIARGLQRPLFSVYRRVIRMYDQKNHIGKYTPAEIERLKDLRVKHGSDWAAIGAALGRSASSVKDRCRLMKDTCNAGKWMPDEEKRLADAVYILSGAQPGDNVTYGLSWAAVAERVFTRSEKQCRTKWLNYLNWKQQGGSEWTRDDDLLLIDKLLASGATDETQVDWSEVAAGWPSVRSPQWLRGKWWSLKKHVLEYQSLSLPILIEVLKQLHMPKMQLKTTADGHLKISNKLDLQQIMALPVHTAGGMVTSIQVPEGCSEVGGDVAGAAGLEVLQGYNPVVSAGHGAFLITQPHNNPAISFASSDMATDHIIVHTLPVAQEVGDEPVGMQLGTQPQQVVLTPGRLQQPGVEEGVETITTMELEEEMVAQTAQELQHLTGAGQITISPEPDISQSELEVEEHISIPGEIIAASDDEFETQALPCSEVVDEVGKDGLDAETELVSVSTTSQFVQPSASDGSDLMQNMSSLSDPMLTSESADLICSASDIEVDKVACGNETDS